eukprot:COSAG01_NODE_1883_length_8988_cov_67.877264_12_plen_535_part_00
MPVLGGGSAVLLLHLMAISLTQPEFDCTARKLAFAQATHLMANSSMLHAGLSSVHDALQLTTACGIEFEPPPLFRGFPSSPLSLSRSADSLTTLHVSTTGNDKTGDGSQTKPFASLRAARDHARAKNDGPAGQTVTTIAVASGRYEVDSELSLGPEDNGLTIEGEVGTVLSGGVALRLLLQPVSPSRRSALGFPPGTMQAQLPPGTPRFSVLYEDTAPATRPQDGHRLPWAREPNGDVENDLQPSHLARARGEGSTPSGPSVNGSMYSIVDTPRRNNSVYPIWGRDYDPRDVDHATGQIKGWQWHHVGGTSRRFGDDVGFFNGTAPTSMRYGDPNATIGARCDVTAGGQCRAFSPFRAELQGWTTEGAVGAIAHVFHPAFWGNWQFEVAKVYKTRGATELHFQRGGFQEGHGGGIGSQPFFVEGVRQALDVKGEWWVDAEAQTLYILPNTTVTSEGHNVTLALIAPVLKTLISVRGVAQDAAVDSAALNITIRGLTFAHTAPTYLEPYIVPSPGERSLADVPTAPPLPGSHNIA